MTTVEEEPFYQWTFHGNIVVPTGNPFDSDPDEEIDPHTLWLGPGLLLCLDHLLMVNRDGLIFFFDHVEDVSLIENQPNFVKLAPHEFLCPGFIDLHIHAPQFAYTGTGWLFAVGRHCCNLLS